MASLKPSVSKWLTSRLREFGTIREKGNLPSLKEIEMDDMSFSKDTEITQRNYFTCGYTGFPDQLIIYLNEAQEGISIGYKAVSWHGPSTPVLMKFPKHMVSWEEYGRMSYEERHEVLLDRLMQTINARKRQYRRCQYCGERTALEHRFDGNTCQGCASKQFGVVY